MCPGNTWKVIGTKMYGNYWWMGTSAAMVVLQVYPKNLHLFYIGSNCYFDPTPLKNWGYAPLGVWLCVRHISSIYFVYTIPPNMNPDILRQDLKHPQYIIFNLLLDNPNISPLF